ncbi:hypothetical protein LBMAG42_01710 [Deltaproteobacteria bacterium]|nr:hypothetical protein LBMAG42_01710 [Deltaproteobacteria bacterium]
MRRVLLVSASVLAVAVAGFVAWRAAREPAPPPVVSLDERPYEQTSDKEREDWMRKLGYVD